MTDLMGQPQEKEMSTLSKTFWTILPLAAAGFIGWYIAPDYIARPYQEATRQDYSDAQQVFNRTEVQHSEGYEDYTQTYHGGCPDLSIMTAKALLDKKLTVGEVHDLAAKAHALYAESGEIDSRNAALRAAGQTLVPNNIDCPDGSSLWEGK